MLTLALVAACISAEDVRKYQCEVACRLGGWNTGTYADGNCLCIDIEPYAEIVGTQLAQLPKIKRVGSAATVTQ
jgi:hypothetical protein